MSLPTLEPIRDEDLPEFCQIPVREPEPRALGRGRGPTHSCNTGARQTEQWLSSFATKARIVGGIGAIYADRLVRGRIGTLLQYHELVRARRISCPKHAARDGGHQATGIPFHRLDADRGRIQDPAIPQVQADGRAPCRLAQSAMAVLARDRSARSQRSRADRAIARAPMMPRLIATTGICHGSSTLAVGTTECVVLRRVEAHPIEGCHGRNGNRAERRAAVPPLSAAR